jgi:type IV pilus assembly protein PilC
LKQLGSLLSAGVNLLAALELLALQQDNRYLRRVYFELYQELYNGSSFSQALQKRPKEFPNLLVQMAQIGEITGDLGNAIKDMGDYYEKQMKIASGIKSAVRMPLIYLGAALLIAIGMLLFVFPNITNLFSAFEGAQLPPITKFFIDVGDFMAVYFIYIALGIIFLTVLIVVLTKTVPQVHYTLTILGLRFPITGKLVQMNNQIMIASSLSQMMANGIHSIKALKTLRGFIKNVVYKDIIEKTLSYVDEGKPFSKAFSESAYIDPIMAKMIATGEKTGEIPKLMTNLANYYNGVSELRVEQLKGALQPILLLVVYAIVGVMLLAIMLPMLSLGTQI